MKTVMSSFRKPSRRPQRGAAAVEFALVALIFFTMLLGIIEFGRFLYLWNTVQEVTRKAAREAVVRVFTNAEIADIQREAIFQGASSANEIGLPAGGEVTNLKVRIRYINTIDSDGTLVEVSQLPGSPAENVAECLTNTTRCIRYVAASICEQGQGQGGNCDPVQYIPMVGLFDFLAVDIPQSTVVMPAESLGFRP